MLGLAEEEIAQQDVQVQQFAHTNLVSLTGWYDYSFAPHLSHQEQLANKNFFWFDRKLKRPLSDPELTAIALTNLDACLSTLTGPSIVSLHFVPHSHFLIDHPYFHRFNGFMGSQAFHDLFVQHGVTEVVFGHLHHRHEPILIDGVRYHCRPLGYQREWKMVRNFFVDFPEFASLNTYRLGKRYNAIQHLPVFQTYKTEKLYQEFKDSLTIIDTENS